MDLFKKTTEQLLLQNQVLQELLNKLTERLTK
jgi:hypothetical protein